MYIGLWESELPDLDRNLLIDAIRRMKKSKFYRQKRFLEKALIEVFGNDEAEEESPATRKRKEPSCRGSARQGRGRRGSALSRHPPTPTFHRRAKASTTDCLCGRPTTRETRRATRASLPKSSMVCTRASSSRDGWAVTENNINSRRRQRRSRPPTPTRSTCSSSTIEPSNRHPSQRTRNNSLRKTCSK